MRSHFRSKSVSLNLLVTRAVLFGKAFSTGISEALIWYFPCLLYRASFVSALNLRQLRVWPGAQLLFLLKPQTRSLCWHLRAQAPSLECWPETSLVFPTFPPHA